MSRDHYLHLSNRYYFAEYRIAIWPTIRARGKYNANVQYGLIINTIENLLSSSPDEHDDPVW